MLAEALNSASAVPTQRVFHPSRCFLPILSLARLSLHFVARTIFLTANVVRVQQEAPHRRDVLYGHFTLQVTIRPNQKSYLHPYFF